MHTHLFRATVNDFHHIPKGRGEKGSEKGAMNRESSIRLDRRRGRLKWFLAAGGRRGGTRKEEVGERKRAKKRCGREFQNSRIEHYVGSSAHLDFPQSKNKCCCAAWEAPALRRPSQCWLCGTLCVVQCVRRRREGLSWQCQMHGTSGVENIQTEVAHWF